VNEPFPAVAEASATGETADLFASIRATVGVRVVNLVWRHLATLDGALPWAWAAVKPLYLHGMVDTAAARLRSGMILPRVGSLAGEEPASVDAVLASYDHSNTMNLLALGALLAWLRGETGDAGTAGQGPRLPAPDISLPPLASEADVSPETWGLVLRLNRFGDRPQPLILASMYRHLAHAPTFLQRMEQVLGQVQADGSLDRAIATNRATAHKEAMRLALAISAPRPALAGEIEDAVAAFLDHAIAKMVTICRAVRVARGRPLRV
jgi:hypothetical protein